MTGSGVSSSSAETVAISSSPDTKQTLYGGKYSESKCQSFMLISYSTFWRLSRAEVSALLCLSL